MKLGLDIHGVINKNPKFFSLLSHLAVSKGYEVHILTGVMLSDKKIEELKAYGVVWTHIFSIADHHKDIGTAMTFADSENPWIDGKTWDMTKAIYCKENNISFHIDDTERYGEYFETPFALYDFTNNRFDWHYKIERRGAFLLTTAEDALDMIEKAAKDSGHAS